MVVCPPLQFAKRPATRLLLRLRPINWMSCQRSPGFQAAAQKWWRSRKSWHGQGRCWDSWRGLTIIACHLLACSQEFGQCVLRIALSGTRDNEIDAEFGLQTHRRARLVYKRENERKLRFRSLRNSVPFPLTT